MVCSFLPCIYGDLEVKEDTRQNIRGQPNVYRDKIPLFNRPTLSASFFSTLFSFSVHNTAMLIGLCGG